MKINQLPSHRINNKTFIFLSFLIQFSHANLLDRMEREEEFRNGRIRVRGNSSSRARVDKDRGTVQYDNGDASAKTISASGATIGVCCGQASSNADKAKVMNNNGENSRAL
jgi:hypothetical protein